MRKHLFSAMAVLGILMVFLLGLGTVNCLASETAVIAQQECTCEPITAIVGCGECTRCDERTIPLCPPARTLGTITKERVIDFVEVLNGRVIVRAHVDKFINYTDTNGVPRIRFVRIPFTCEIPIPGIVETDTVAFQQLTITSETDTLSCDGRSLDERLCVRINVSIQRILDCRLVCPNS
jgi:hypothetical protein